MSRKWTAGWIRTGAFSAVLALATVGAGATRAENLADALIGAYNTSGLLEQNRAVLRAADEDVAQAISTLRPVLDFVARARTTNQRLNPGGILSELASNRITAGLELTWLLFDGGARELGLTAAKEIVLATRQTLLSFEQRVLQRAVAAYMNVILQTENVSLRENNVRVLGEELRAAQDRFEVGEVTRTDVALAESRLAAARSNLAAARGLLVNAQAEYTNAVGRRPGTLVTPTNLPRKPASIEAAQAVAVRTHPDILAAQRQVAALELRILQAERGLGPSVAGSVAVGLIDSWDSDNDGFDSSVSLDLRQPIYRGGALQSNVRSAMANRDAARGNLLNVQRDTVQGVNDAYVRLEVARASLVATAERVRAAQVAFDGIREEATLGARTTLDVLAAEQELLDALTSQISARAEEVIASYQLLATQGLLTAERLGLAVQIYDPTIYYNLAKDAPARVSRQSRDLDRVLEALGKK
ncbi:TolC family outer membrane protein [Sedimentitalea sp. JM2-8]|uniref:TolC family outer membrane protein n=1 Tax=Sedimentitalea xiamensis TaxID=3050037 RepID=A0ABT7FGT6_9RHOB|nr:TolC family outer membrane protein [Sedimentitalea xiamensis]MDK3074359.1 TolC family outer membrane protein [Sedimentitalea xiamensis]